MTTWAVFSMQAGQVGEPSYNSIEATEATEANPVRQNTLNYIYDLSSLGHACVNCFPYQYSKRSEGPRGTKYRLSDSPRIQSVWKIPMYSLPTVRTAQLLTKRPSQLARGSGAPSWASEDHRIRQPITAGLAPPNCTVQEACPPGKAQCRASLSKVVRSDKILTTREQGPA